LRSRHPGSHALVGLVRDHPAVHAALHRDQAFGFEDARCLAQLFTAPESAHLTAHLSYRANHCLHAVLMKSL
jgi:hypothetical protein